jgi:hypothetical protein
MGDKAIIMVVLIAVEDLDSWIPEGKVSGPRWLLERIGFPCDHWLRC